ncbi:MAG: DUF2878 domain-containing protein [Planctomycetota bacterium]
MANDPGQPNDPSFRTKVVNFIVFQLVYFACVFGAVAGNHWIGPLAGAVLLPINLAFAPFERRRTEPALWIACGLIGFVVDSGLLAAGAIGFPEITRIAPDSSVSAWLVPPWIVTLWVAVGTMLRTSLDWLKHRPVLATVLGAVARTQRPSATGVWP